MTYQQQQGPRPGPGGMAEPCGHRRSVRLPGGPLVVAGVSGSPGSVHALRSAAELARRHGAALVPVLAWVPPGGDLLEHKYPDPELRRLWKQDAWQRLRGVLGTAFGGFPYGVRTWPLVLRGEAGPELVSLASQPGDLLVIGAGRRTALTRLVCCPVARHCLAHAHCPVLAVPPPDLARHAGHGLRGWAFRHRGLDHRIRQTLWGSPDKTTGQVNCN
jgi:nucleotide-binding universal stress UspA family protein